MQMNLIDNYNHTMGNVDVTDQLRGAYRLDHWVRNRKWWWSMLFWALGTKLVNAFVLYIKVNEAYGIPKEKLMSHYKFQKSVALSWIGTGNYEGIIAEVKKKLKIEEEGSDVSRLTFDSFSRMEIDRVKGKCSRVTDASLDASTGLL